MRLAWWWAAWAVVVAPAALAQAAPAAPAAPAVQAAPSALKVPDTMEQRMLACSPCHGAQGEGLRKNEYYPRLANKPVGYLYNQLLNFRDKRREYALMNYIVAYLSDGYLFEIANYYAALNPPYPSPTTRAGAAELALGGKLVKEGDPARGLPSCVSCHGQTLTGMEPSIPGLVGLYPPYITAQMGAWKDDKRHAMKPDCMAAVAKKLTPAEIGAITAWLTAQPVPADVRAVSAGSLTLPMECGGLTPKVAKKK